MMRECYRENRVVTDRSHRSSDSVYHSNNNTQSYEWHLVRTPLQKPVKKIKVSVKSGLPSHLPIPHLSALSSSKCMREEWNVVCCYWFDRSCHYIIGKTSQPHYITLSGFCQKASWVDYRKNNEISQPGSIELLRRIYKHVIH